MWAVEHWGVKPDILLTAKGIAQRHAARRDDRPRGPAGGVGPGRARLDVRRQPGRLRRRRSRRSTCSRAASSRTPRRAASRRSPACVRSSTAFDGLVRDVRGKGLMIGVEFDTRRARRGGPVGRLPARAAGARVRRVERAHVAGADRDRGRDGDRRCGSSARRWPRSPATHQLAGRRAGVPTDAGAVQRRSKPPLPDRP